MTAHPDLTPEQASVTDEELAEIERAHEEWGNLGGEAFCKMCWPTRWPCRTSRLVAALQASRAEVERLRPWATIALARAIQAGGDMQAEVEKMKAAMESTGIDFDALQERVEALGRPIPPSLPSDGPRPQ